jgi:cell wall-associated NlpC family hydrolase
LVIPGGIVTRQEFRDSQIEQSHDYWQDFYDGKPTTKAGESAALGRQLATSAQPAWIAMNTDYYQIGTKQEQTMYSSVNDMLFSPGDLNPNQSIIIDNGNGMFTVYNMSQLAALSDDERQQVVYAWLDQNKGVSDAYTKVKDGRAAFKTEHPDYAQYTEYQKGVFGYQGGISQFRRDMADNPTFKAAEDAQRAELKKQGKSGAVLEAELDHWATTQQAFFAATGQKYKTDDTIKGTPGPSSVAAMFSLRPDKESSGSGGTKKEAPKDPTINDFWSPAKGIPRLQEDQAQYDYDNRKMEQDFGPYWNEQTGKWEKNADSAKERDELGIGEDTYVLPSITDTMRRYQDWEEDHPGGSPEEFFAEMLQTPGFGKKVGGATTSTPSLPGGTVVTKPTGVSAAPTTAGGRLQAAVQNLKYVTNAPKPGSRPQEAGVASEVIKVADSFVGNVPYVWGGIPGKGETPTGWDCSGMTYWLDQNYGNGQLPMGSHYQYQYAQETGQLFTDMAQLQPGDIVFIDTGWMGGAGAELNRSGHVGIYAGNGQLINALNPDAGTVIEPLTDFDNVLGAMHGSWTGA